MFVFNKEIENPKLHWAGTIEYTTLRKKDFIFMISSNKCKKLEEKYFSNDSIPVITISGFSFLGIHLLRVEKTSLKMAMTF